MDDRLVSRYYTKELADDQSILDYIDKFELANHRRSLQLISKEENPINYSRYDWMRGTSFVCKFKVIDLTDVQWAEAVVRLNKSTEQKIIDLEHTIVSYQVYLVDLKSNASIIKKRCTHWWWRLCYHFCLDDMEAVTASIDYYKGRIEQLQCTIYWHRQSIIL